MTKWWWLSFCDPNLPQGNRFLGVIVIEAMDIKDACDRAWDMKINPGGEVLGYELSKSFLEAIKVEDRQRLLSKEEATFYAKGATA